MIFTTGTGRFTPGQIDATFTPDGGSVPGLPPFVFMYGGGTLPDTNPATTGVDVKLEALTDAGYSIMCPSVPWLLGNDTALDRIDDAIAYHRANWQGTMDPPILSGISNGAICSTLYYRSNPITAAVLMLPPTNVKDPYIRDDNGAMRNHVQEAWGVTYPTMPPDRFSPWHDQVDNGSYDVEALAGKIQAWFSGGDVFDAGHQASFYTMLHTEQHNIGAYGHFGDIDDPSIPLSHMDEAEMVAFVNARVAEL